MVSHHSQPLLIISTNQNEKNVSFCKVLRRKTQLYFLRIKCAKRELTKFIAIQMKQRAGNDQAIITDHQIEDKSPEAVAPDSKE